MQIQVERLIESNEITSSLLLYQNVLIAVGLGGRVLCGIFDIARMGGHIPSLPFFILNWRSRRFICMLSSFNIWCPIAFVDIYFNAGFDAKCACNLVSRSDCIHWTISRCYFSFFLFAFYSIFLLQILATLPVVGY